MSDRSLPERASESLIGSWKVVEAEAGSPEEPSPSPKLNTRSSKKNATFEGSDDVAPELSGDDATKYTAPEEENNEDRDSATGDADDSQDLYEHHFGGSTIILSDTVRDSVESRSWNASASSFSKVGSVVTFVPSGFSLLQVMQILKRLKEPFDERQSKLPKAVGNRDLYHTHASYALSSITREAISLHVLNHVSNADVFSKMLSVSHATKNKAPIPDDIQDQGFTRPSILILLPFRCSALSWLDALRTHTPPPTYQVENIARSRREFGLPEGAVDKLATAEPGTYPPDHVDIFKARDIDEGFRVGVGIEVMRKSLRLFSEFYASDIIIASPLGSRQSIEKRSKSADFLSSFEVLVMDQTDALTMQSCQHVQFVVSQTDEHSKESHDTDFSRIKPWYLEKHAAYLRQSILLTALFINTSLKNVAGKLSTKRQWSPVQVPDELEQNFIQLDCTMKDEPDKRFAHFTTQIIMIPIVGTYGLPAILKSAVQSANTANLTPSSLDFIRVQNHFRKQALSFTAFVLVSERFHFYRRYKIRGIRNLVFYGPPDHSIFYTELLSYPLLDEEVELADVTCKVLYSRYDWF
ncbi:DUF1253-domain-containing protein [Auriscalpium vulgare]|uniref:DUF1253-domain-containing protein n=1 Tax=Auriscalpium vulgare TaxID=40419 RepID=A0ACB8R6V7_9AGAM|nr:DUF1253-domain-containing protein [Auriscalpium vulgare]